MGAVVNGWEMSELVRAARRSREKGDGGRLFARAAARVLDDELVRAIEHQSGLAIEEHMVAVFTASDGRSLAAALSEHVHALGLPLVVEAADDGADDDGADEDGVDGVPEDGTGEHPHVERLRSRGTTMLAGGIALLALGSVTCVLSIGLALASIEGRLAGLVCFVVTTLPVGLAGLALAWAGARRRKRAERLRDLEGLGLSHARLPLHLVERELGLGAADARALIREALGHGVLEGRLDLEDGVFVSAIADPRVGQRAVRCATCGAGSVVLRAPGAPRACPYCGARARR